MKTIRFVLAILVAGATLGARLPAVLAQQNPFVGRWNLTGTGANADHVYWVEITDEGGKLSGRFLDRVASPVPIQSIKVENGELVFSAGRDRGTPPEYRARIQGNHLVGSVQNGNRKIDFIGQHPPKWPAVDANARHTLGQPVELVGRSMDTWDLQYKDKPAGWSIADGVMANQPPANNLISKQKFKDFQIHAEYKLDKDSNSGIYLRGRYELQVLDDFGKPVEEHGHMSIYAWKAPLVNASKPVGEWQTMDATVVGNKVSVTLNGQKVQDNATLEAITGGALDANESEPGPIMLQGDHGKVWYRKVTVTPIK